MRPTLFLIILAIIYLVECRNHVKSLTENTGHEVIEIGTPLKDLPPGVEEEPSAENEEEVSTKASSPTKRDPKRVVTTTQKKEVEKEDTVSQEDEEARIEKELAEIYKDTDYKSESAETNKDAKRVNTTDVDPDKTVLRARNAFKVQPDLNRTDIERSRTSVDDIGGNRRAMEKLRAEAQSNAASLFLNLGQIVLAVSSSILCY